MTLARSIIVRMNIFWTFRCTGCTISGYRFCSAIDTSFQSTKIHCELCVLLILHSRFCCCCASVDDEYERRLVRRWRKSNLSDPHSRATARSWIFFEKYRDSYSRLLSLLKNTYHTVYSIFLISSVAAWVHSSQKLICDSDFLEVKRVYFFGHNNWGDIIFRTILEANSKCLPYPCWELHISCTSRWRSLHQPNHYSTTLHQT